jgi:hypothetical protein
LTNDFAGDKAGQTSYTLNLEIFDDINAVASRPGNFAREEGRRRFVEVDR